MKKNMIPLVAIAFVVAVVSTAVFYGLFAGKLRSSGPESGTQAVVVAARNLDRGAVLQAADLRVSELRSETRLQSSLSKTDQAVGQTLAESIQAGEPITLKRLGSRAASGVPKGKRAISIRVADSAGIVGSLGPGAKVDVQAFSGRGGTFELKTILQNVEVLSVNPQPESREGGAASVVTVLTRPQDTDLLALADSGARIRVALRNAVDNDILPSRSLATAVLFQSGREAVSVPTPQTVEGAAASTVDRNPFQLSVHLLGASANAVREIDSKLAEQPAGDGVRVASFRGGIDTEDLIHSLAEKHELDVLSSSRLTTNVHRPANLNAGTDACQLRIQFSPERDGGANGTLRVRPVISWKRSEGVETRGFETDVPGGKGFVLSGLLRSPTDRSLLEGIFPGRSWNGRELVILVTPTQSKPVHTARLARANRGR